MSAIFYALATLQDKLATEDREKGATAVEYGLLIALVSIVLVVALAALQGPMTTLVTNIGGMIGGAGA